MFGDEDFKTMKLNNLPIFLDKHLCFLKDFSVIEMSAGTFLLDTEIPVIKYLAKNGLLFSKERLHILILCVGELILN